MLFHDFLFFRQKTKKWLFIPFLFFNKENKTIFTHVFRKYIY